MAIPNCPTCNARSWRTELIDCLASCEVDYSGGEAPELVNQVWGKETHFICRACGVRYAEYELEEQGVA